MHVVASHYHMCLISQTCTRVIYIKKNPQKGPPSHFHLGITYNIKKIHKRVHGTKIHRGATSPGITRIGAEILTGEIVACRWRGHAESRLRDVCRHDDHVTNRKGNVKSCVKQGATTRVDAWRNPRAEMLDSNCSTEDLTTPLPLPPPPVSSTPSRSCGRTSSMRTYLIFLPKNPDMLPPPLATAPAPGSPMDGFCAR
jgi:hypothetical protein